jgi:hypothetical protein
VCSFGLPKVPKTDGSLSPEDEFTSVCPATSERFTFVGVTWQAMSAEGELAKMGGEGASPKGHRGTDVSGHVGGWVLDEAGFRRVGLRRRVK